MKTRPSAVAVEPRDQLDGRVRRRGTAVPTDAGICIPGNITEKAEVSMHLQQDCQTELKDNEEITTYLQQDCCTKLKDKAEITTHSQQDCRIAKLEDKAQITTYYLQQDC